MVGLKEEDQIDRKNRFYTQYSIFPVFHHSPAISGMSVAS
jgi:hypothetical protein